MYAQVLTVRVFTLLIHMENPTPTVLYSHVNEEDSVLIFIDAHEARKYWMFLPNRDCYTLLELNADLTSGAWILPKVS
jgi:hypothetical protein